MSEESKESIEGPARGPGLRPFPRLVWLFVASKVVFHVVTTRLEHHRDELYFISASKRLAASFVDFQPITPLLLRIERELFGESLIGLRMIPALAGALVIVLGVLIARELGGDRRAQLLAGFVMLVAPMFVGMNATLNTVSLETPAWMLVTLVTARFLRTRDERFWLAIGVASGLALLVKFTMVAYLGALGIAVLATQGREALRSRWLWLGAIVGGLMIAPSIVWQFGHDLAAVEFVSNQGGGGAVLGLRGRLGYLASLVVLPGIVAVLVYVPGLVWLWRNRTYRLLGIAHGIALVAFFAASGKGYYAFPAVAVLLSAGSVSLIKRRDAYPKALMAGVGISLVVSLLFVVPIAPLSVYRNNPDLAAGAEIGERVGWKEFARTIARIKKSLPARDRERVVVIGDNYTLPSALEFYGVGPAVSGHNSAYLWWPPIHRDHVAIIVGFERQAVLGWYREAKRVGTVRNTLRIRNYDWGAPIFVARGPKLTPGELRERIKTFEA